MAPPSALERWFDAQSKASQGQRVDLSLTARQTFNELKRDADFLWLHAALRQMKVDVQYLPSGEALVGAGAAVALLCRVEPERTASSIQAVVESLKFQSPGPLPPLPAGNHSEFNCCLQDVIVEFLGLVIVAWIAGRCGSLTEMIDVYTETFTAFMSHQIRQQRVIGTDKSLDDPLAQWVVEQLGSQMNWSFEVSFTGSLTSSARTLLGASFGHPFGPDGLRGRSKSKLLARELIETAGGASFGYTGVMEDGAAPDHPSWVDFYSRKESRDTHDSISVPLDCQTPLRSRQYLNDGDQRAFNCWQLTNMAEVLFQLAPPYTDILIEQAGRCSLGLVDVANGAFDILKKVAAEIDRGTPMDDLLPTSLQSYFEGDGTARTPQLTLSPTALNTTAVLNAPPTTRRMPTLLHRSVDGSVLTTPKRQSLNDSSSLIPAPGTAVVPAIGHTYLAHPSCSSRRRSSATTFANSHSSQQVAAMVAAEQHLGDETPVEYTAPTDEGPTSTDAGGPSSKKYRVRGTKQPADQPDTSRLADVPRGGGCCAGGGGCAAM